MSQATGEINFGHFEQLLAESISQENRYHSVPYLYYYRFMCDTATTTNRDFSRGNVFAAKKRQVGIER